MLNFTFDAQLELDSVEKILARRGLGAGGTVQRYIDTEVIKLCEPKVPFATGTLAHSAITATDSGSGIIIWSGPYAHYLYYGEVYGPNIPIWENGVVTGFFSPPSKAKHPTGQKLTYNGAPERGAFWFDRMKAERGADIVRGAAAIAGGTAK